MFFYNSVLLVIISAILYLYWYFKKTYSFFERHGIPFIKPTLGFGNISDVILLRKSMAEVFADLHKTLEPHKFGGIYAGTKPMIMIRDPELLKDILIKDFAYFSDRGFNIDRSFEPLSYNLFLIKGKYLPMLKISKKWETKMTKFFIFMQEMNGKTLG